MKYIRPNEMSFKFYRSNKASIDDEISISGKGNISSNHLITKAFHLDNNNMLT